MIKTLYKSKPINGTKHPIGTKQISELLHEIDIYNHLSISFDKEKGQPMGIILPGWNDRFMKEESKDLLEFYKIISGDYSAQRDKWSIKLKAVEIKNNKLIKIFLIEIGIPLLRNWFESEKFEPWYSGNRHFQIGLNKNLTEYCTWETQDNQTVKKKIEIISPSLTRT